MVRIKFAVLSVFEIFVWEFLAKFFLVKAKDCDNDIRRESRLLWVGCDFNQDKSSLLPGLKVLFPNLTIYTDGGGEYSFRRIGKDFRSINTRRLCDLVDEYDTEVIMFQSWAPFFDYKFIKNYKRSLKLIGISWDDALPELWLHHYYKSFWYVSKYFDVVLISNSNYENRYRYFVSDVRVMPMGYSPKHYAVSKCEQVYDLIFVGNNYGYRKRIVQMLLSLEKSHDLKIRLYGRGMRDGYLDSEFIGTEYNRSRIVLGCGLVGNSNRRTTYKLRDMEALASGALYIAQGHKDFILDSNSTVPTYKSIDSLKKLILYYLSNKDKRENLAKKQHMSAQDFDWTNVFKKVLFK